jgi:hypothetical protein
MKRSLPVAALRQSLAHPTLAPAFVVIPAIVHEGNAAVDGLVNQARGFSLCERSLAYMRAAESDGGDSLTSSAELAIEHLAP